MKRHRPIPMRARRAFTLLELLLATTVLAAITALVAVTWAQMSDWAGDGTRDRESMRLHRVVRLMTDQWEDRRSTVPIGEENQPVVTTSRGFTFMTATPILFPDWPIVQASYQIVPSPDRRPGDPDVWDLMYTEERLVSFGASEKDDDETEAEREARRNAIDVNGRELVRELRLLHHCPKLYFERFGVAATIDLPATAIGAKGEDSAVATDEDGEPAEAVDPLDSGAIELAQESGVSDEEINDAMMRRWRPHEDYDGPIWAIRVIGTFMDQEFSCVFAIRASH